MLQPDTQTGDIVFVLQQKEHPKFKRKGDDLFVERTLTLTEALCGFHFALSHLDGRQLLIKTIPGEIIKPGLFSLLFRSKCYYYLEHKHRAIKQGHNFSLTC
jgi:DnaJ family protein A protein 2